eukprot:m.17776 g.17776  ORF g.17776 m.17776 type:complete len:115 (-) comp11670_c0_seq1:225-569(-)
MWGQFDVGGEWCGVGLYGSKNKNRTNKAINPETDGWHLPLGFWLFIATRACCAFGLFIATRACCASIQDKPKTGVNVLFLVVAHRNSNDDPYNNQDDKDDDDPPTGILPPHLVL